MKVLIRQREGRDSESQRRGPPHPRTRAEHRALWGKERAILRRTLRHPLGASAFAAVSFLYAGLYLYLSGMLLHKPNMTFDRPISFPFVDIGMAGKQPFLLFLPTDDFILLVNLTGALVTLALSVLVGVNIALLARHWPWISWRRQGAGVLAALAPSLVPNIACCTGVPVLLALLPTSASGFAVVLGKQFGALMAGVILVATAGTWYHLRTIAKVRERMRGPEPMSADNRTLS